MCFLLVELNLFSPTWFPFFPLSARFLFCSPFLRRSPLKLCLGKLGLPISNPAQSNLPSLTRVMPLLHHVSSGVCFLLSELLESFLSV